jgi:hypothetical protein
VHRRMPSTVETRVIVDLMNRVPRNVFIEPQPFQSKHDYMLIDARMPEGCHIFMLHSRLNEDVKRLIWQNLRQSLVKTNPRVFGGVRVLKQSLMPQTVTFNPRTVPDITTIAVVAGSTISLFHLTPKDVLSLTCNAYIKQSFRIQFNSVYHATRRLHAFVSHEIPIR